ncbi:hypothetical protein [Streptomyces spiralis]
MNVSSDAAARETPNGLHPEARYEFKIDRMGDAVEDLVSPIFAQFDDELAERLNQTAPEKDIATFAQEITDRVAAVVDVRAHHLRSARLRPGGRRPHSSEHPSLHHRYSCGVRVRGVHGRTLNDNAGEVMFSLATNSALGIDLGKDAVDAPPTLFFPYLAPAT